MNARAKQQAVLMTAAEVADALRLLIEASNRAAPDEAFTMQAGQAAAMLLACSDRLTEALSRGAAPGSTEAVNGEARHDG
jgi:hypothetical protein